MVHVVGRTAQVFCFPGHDCKIVCWESITMVNDGTRMSEPCLQFIFQSGLSVDQYGASTEVCDPNYANILCYICGYYTCNG